MSTAASLKEIERRAYRSTFEDGIYDIVFGAVLLILAAIPVFEFIGLSKFYGYPFLLIPALASPLAKRRITIPRLGAVEFGGERTSKRRYSAIVGIAALLLMLPVVIMMFAKGFPAGPSWMAVGLIAAPAVLIGVVFLDYPRMYIYGAVLLFCIVEAEMLQRYLAGPFNALIAFGMPGAVILVYGLAQLCKFLKKYPKPAPEDFHDNQ